MNQLTILDKISNIYLGREPNFLKSILKNMPRKQKRKNILITGGAGYLGGAVTDLLLEKGRYNLRVYDNLLYEESYRKPVNFVYGDVLDKKRLKSHLDWADCVIWLAAIVGDGACELDQSLTTQVNQESLKWLAENFNGRIIFTSTCSAYGAQNNLILKETSLVDPLSVYAYTKLKAEEYLKNKDAIIFRLGTLFGVSDLFSRIRMDLIVNLLTGRALSTGRISIFGGEQYRPLLHVRDAAEIIVKSIEFKRLSRAEVFNLTKINMKMINLAYKVKKYFPKLIIEKTKMPFRDTRNYQVSCAKAKKNLKFRPKLTVDFGIKQMADIFENNRIKALDSPRYSNQLFLKDKLNKK